MTVSKGFGAVALVAAVLTMTAYGLKITEAAEAAHLVPPPSVDEPASHATTEVAIFAGGCFWGVQGVFQHVEGVTNAVSGYTGGEAKTAQYEIVSTGTTGHAESVQVTFNPRKVTYGQLLRIYFSVAHDPTELNYQGPDEGTQYRSAVFPTNPEQARVAKAYIEQIDQAKIFHAAVVTRIETGKTFYPAEGYHQNYLTLHLDNPYIAINDLPKIQDLKKLFPNEYQANATLVAAAR